MTQDPLPYRTPYLGGPYLQHSSLNILFPPKVSAASLRVLVYIAINSWSVSTTKLANIELSGS